MENKFYIYHLINPMDNIVFYVGKGFGNRMFQHEKDVKRGILPHKNSYLYHKIDKILKSGYSIIYKKIFENLNEDDALLKEMEEIKRIGRANRKTGTLCNLTDGGEGASGLIYTEEMRKYRSMLFSGEKNPMYGKNHTDKTKKIISDKRKNRIWNFKHTQEHKEKLRNDNTGGKYTSKPVIQFDINGNFIFDGSRKPISFRGWDECDP